MKCDRHERQVSTDCFLHEALTNEPKYRHEKTAKLDFENRKLQQHEVLENLDAGSKSIQNLTDKKVSCLYKLT